MSMRKCNLLGSLMLAALLLMGRQAFAESAGPKLKYRSNGPVCSCESGTGEAEIQAAMARLGIQDDVARKTASSRAEVGQEDHSKESQQHRRETDEEHR